MAFGLEAGPVDTGPTQFIGTYTLRVEPDQAREAQKLYLHQVDKLNPLLDAGYTELNIEPWLGDPVSKETAMRFTYLLKDSDGSPLNRLKQFRDRLQAVADACGKIADEYERTEQANKDTFDKGFRRD